MIVVTLQSLLIGKQDDNKASKKIREQKKNKRTNSPYNDVSRLSPRSIQYVSMYVCREGGRKVGK